MFFIVLSLAIIIRNVTGILSSDILCRRRFVRYGLSSTHSFWLTPFNELNWMSTGWYPHGLDISSGGCLGQSRTRYRLGSYVVAATHGKRAVDNLSHFRLHIKEHKMDSEVTRFEESILFFADAHRLHDPGSNIRDQSSASPQTPIELPNVSCIMSPPLTCGPTSLHKIFEWFKTHFFRT